jgi:hypothetical protein
MSSEEIIWEQILSRDPAQVRAAFFVLDVETQQGVVEHLRVMTSEEGWHPEQVISAQKALDAISKDK